MNIARNARLLGAAVAIGAVAVTGLSRPAHAAPAGNASGAGSAGGPLGGLTANQIAARALHDLTSATSVHFAVSGRSDGVTISAAITLAGQACDGTISAGRFATFGFIQIGTTGWTLLSKQFLAAFGYSQAQISKYAGKWLKNNPMTDSDASQVCSIKLFSHGFPAKGWTLGRVTTLSGHRVVTIVSKKPKVTAYILDSARPEFVKFSGDGATATFSGFNARVAISPPPPGMVISTLPPPPGL